MHRAEFAPVERVRLGRVFNLHLWVGPGVVLFVFGELSGTETVLVDDLL